MNNLVYDMESAPWDLVDLFDDPDDALWCWETILKETLSTHIKTRKVKVRRDNQPWMTGKIRKILKRTLQIISQSQKYWEKLHRMEGL